MINAFGIVAFMVIFPFLSIKFIQYILTIFILLYIAIKEEKEKTNQENKEEYNE